MNLNLRISDWGTEILSEDNSAFLLLSAGIKKESLGEIVNNPSIPILGITSLLYQEIRYIVGLIPRQECAMFLTMKRINTNLPHFLAFDFFMPVQEASGGHVSLSVEDSMTYYTYLETTYPYYAENGLHRNLCHIHSHGAHGAFWSGTDNTQQNSREELGFYDDFRFYIVVNAKGELKASLVTYAPVLSRVDAAIALVFSRAEYVGELTKQRKQELQDMVKARVKSPVQVPKPIAGITTTAGKCFGTEAFGRVTNYGDPLYATYWNKQKSTSEKDTVPQVTEHNSEKKLEISTLEGSHEYINELFRLLYYACTDKTTNRECFGAVGYFHGVVDSEIATVVLSQFYVGVNASEDFDNCIVLYINALSFLWEHRKPISTLCLTYDNFVTDDYMYVPSIGTLEILFGMVSEPDFSSELLDSMVYDIAEYSENFCIEHE